jgi:hypothetical protein
LLISAYNSEAFMKAKAAFSMTPSSQDLTGIPWNGLSWLRMVVLPVLPGPLEPEVNLVDGDDGCDGVMSNAMKG